jgi:hypothetical protein
MWREGNGRNFARGERLRALARARVSRRSPDLFLPAAVLPPEREYY